MKERFAFGAGSGKVRAKVFAKMIGIHEEMMARGHPLDGLRMTLRNPMMFGVFIHNIDVAGVILAGEQDDGAMRVTVIHGGEPFHGIGLAEATQAREVIPESRVSAGAGREQRRDSGSRPNTWMSE